ncbi:sugar phosphate isomerase/epimerase family protein [Brevibacillus panacihumi]|uniref:sugar phosphate isomerase/epimerase family protein n=1 Tax=Brevibacillus panacihumi TaxID=497735 RepID=UPI003D21C7C9
MNKHRFGVSGSTILTSPEQFGELFWDDIDVIEIGEFPNESAFRAFLDLCKEKQMPFGVHSPLLRNGSKYDLIEKVSFEPIAARKNLEREAALLSRLGAEYILVHFPYFKGETTENVNEKIENGLKDLSRIQKEYGIPIVCEPKLGMGRSAKGIQYLDSFPIKKWEKYNLKLCIDIGDYLIATGDEIVTYLEKWKDHIKVVHLHNVAYEGDRYIWIPVHPSHEDKGKQYKIAHILSFLSKCKEINFIFEHTPHTNPSKEFVLQGYLWTRNIVRSSGTNE